jgi:hypothetical protein
VLSAAELAEAIGYPLSWWPGHCYRVVAGALSAGLLYGVFAYGSCAGYDHGWVRMGDTIVDPTLWTLLGTHPEITVVDPTSATAPGYTEWGIIGVHTPLFAVPPHILACLLED